MIDYDYKFKTQKYQNSWRCIQIHTFENMELYFRKQFSMQKLLSNFRKVFHIAPITLKNSTEDKYYRYKLLAIYLLTKYSKESFENIAIEFKISIKTVILIFSNNRYQMTFDDEIKLFFKHLEDDYLYDRKSTLALQERLEMVILRK